MSNILLLEDDVVLSKEIKSYLTKLNFNCDLVYDGNFVCKQLRLKNYDLIILDINVPGINGIEVCEEIRKSNNFIPILMLTAFGEIEDKINAFNKGADDYLVKPFHFEELIIRIKSLLRRKEFPITASNIMKVSDLEIDLDNLTVFRNGKEIILSPKEFKLLTILAKSNGRVLSKNQISDELWDYHIETSQNTIEVYINFLRKKIDKDHPVKLIHTKIGYGYYLKEDL
jgi:DNA-binding response OmpR family regulator